MTESGIMYGVCHRQASWRVVAGASQFASFENALFGPLGARNLFLHQGRVAARTAKYGEPLFSGVWDAGLQSGLLTNGQRLFVVPMVNLASIQDSRVASKAFKTQALAERETEAAILARELATLSQSSPEYDFEEAALRRVLREIRRA